MSEWGPLQKFQRLVAVATDPSFSRADVATFAAISDRINWKNGGAYPSYETISADAQVSKRQAIRSVKKLDARGFIIRVPGNRHRSNVYGLGYGPQGKGGRRVTDLVNAGSLVPMTCASPKSINSNQSSKSERHKDRIDQGVNQALGKAKRSVREKPSRAEQLAVLDAAKLMITKGLV